MSHFEIVIASYQSNVVHQLVPKNRTQVSRMVVNREKMILIYQVCDERRYILEMP
jgi:hypothetical protein